MRLSLRTAVLVAAALVATLVAIPAVSSNAAAGDSSVTVLHGIPNVPVDVYVNDALTLTDFQPGDITDPLALPEASYAIKIFGHIDNPPASAAARVDAPAISQSVPVPASKDVSLIANVSNTGALVLNAFVNDTTKTANGKARVTVRHTANAPTVDILVDGVRTLKGLEYGKEVSAELPAGTYTFAVAVSPDGATVLTLPNVKIEAGTDTIVYAIGAVNNDPGPLGTLVQTQTVGQEAAPTTTTTAPPTTVAPTTTTVKPATPAPASPAFTG